MPFNIENNVKNQSPLISIIVPVYNTEKYLDKCIISLINQTLINIEIIFINDGSTDNSLDILENYQKNDLRIKVINQKNSGPATARNVGLKKSLGKYVMFCDSDDWFEPEMCQTMYKTIETTKVDLVMCDTNFQFTGQIHNRNTLDIEAHKLKLFGKLFLTEKNKHKIFVVLWNKIFKKSIIDKYKITFPDGCEFDDNSFIYQYLAGSKTAFGNSQKLYNYNVRDGSIMASLKHSEKYHHMIGALEHTLIALNTNNLIKNGEFINLFFQSTINWFYKNLDTGDRLIFFNLIKEKLIPQIPNDIITENNFLSQFSDQLYPMTLKRISRTHTITKFKLLGYNLFKVKKNLTKEKYYFIGLQYFKISIDNKMVIYYLFGLPLWTKFNIHSNNN